MFTTFHGEVAKAIYADRIEAADRYRRGMSFRRWPRSSRRTEVEVTDVPVIQPVLPEQAPYLPPVPALADLAQTSKAVRVGSVIEVGATAATGEDGRIMYPGDPYEQTRRALEAVAEALREAGANVRDIVRTRVFLKKTWQWEDAGKAHGEFFGEVRPATTFVGAGGFIDSEMLVAVEATALVPE